MANQRGWTWINEDEEHSDDQNTILNELASQWSDIHNQIEQEGFRRQAAYEDGDYDDPGDYFDTQEEIDAWKKQDRARQVARDTRLRVIENMLHELGARMMRPYEHWNEDERYMQYMECDRFGDSCY